MAEVWAWARAVPSWALAGWILGVWCLWAVAAMAQVAGAGARRGVPPAERGGFSPFPVVPIFPLGLWFLAWLLDRGFRPWGTVTLGAAHGAFALALAVSIGRDVATLRALDRRGAARGRTTLRDASNSGRDAPREP